MASSSMLSFCVFTTRQSRSSLPAPAPFLRTLHSTLFFSVDCALFSVTDISQPFAYQSFPHSFRHDGGVPLSRCFLSAPLCAMHANWQVMCCVFCSLRTLLRSRKAQPVSFQAIPHSLQKTTGGGVGVHSPQFPAW